MTYVATAALALTLVSLLPPGGVLFAPFLFGLFLLSLVGVLARHSNRSAPRRGPTLDATGWRGRGA